MKKLFTTFAALALSVVMLSAQSSDKKEGFNLSVQGGLSISKSENTFVYPDFKETGKLFKGHVGLAAGYDFSDKFGLRLSVSYSGNPGALNSRESGDNYYPYKFNSVNVFTDAILNFNTQERSFSPKLYAGVGGAHSFKFKQQFTGVPTGVAKEQWNDMKSSYTTFGFRFGFIAQYDFNEVVGVFADLCGEAYTDKYNGLTKAKGSEDTGFPFDMRGLLSVGVIFHF